MAAMRTIIVAAMLMLPAVYGDNETCGCATSRSGVSGKGDDGTCTAKTGDSADTAAPRGLSGDYSRWAHLSAVVRIPAGSSVTGTSTPFFKEDAEGPPLPFTLHKDIWMDKYEVSNARFAEFTAATGYASEAETYGWSFVHELAVPLAVKDSITQQVQGAEWWLPVPNASWRMPEGLQSDIESRMDHPALHLSQRDAVAFCTWAGGRVPSEAEWEHAARGGKKDRLFPWGNALTTPGQGVGEEGERDKSARVHRVNIWQGTFPSNNTGEDGYMWAAPVTALGEQNAYGLFHITGNVWEWTSDTWCPNVDGAGSPVPKPSGGRGARLPQECGRLGPRDFKKFKADLGEIDFVKKGGSFMCHKDYCYRYRVAARHKNTANSSAYNLGARCVYDRKPARELATKNGEEEEKSGERKGKEADL